MIERDDHPIVKKQTLVRLPIRLGEDVFADGKISSAKCDYLIKGLKAFRLLTEVYGVTHLRCCATSAMREASNSKAVMDRVEMESGVHIETIAGTLEADLIVNTFWTQDLLKDRTYLYIDVGCLLYTSDAADERSSVDLGGRRIIKKKNIRQDTPDVKHSTLVQRQTERTNKRNNKKQQ